MRGDVPGPLGGLPLVGPPGEFFTHLRPIVKRRRIEIRAVRPHQRAGLGIKTDSVEDVGVTQRPEQAATENRQQVDNLLGPVVERHHQGVRAGNLEPGDAMDSVLQALPEWVDLDGRLA